MEILIGSATKLLHTKKTNPFNHDGDGDRNPLSYDENSHKNPFSSLFRKNNVSFYDDLRTEATHNCLHYKIVGLIENEFEKINEIINNIDYLDTLKEKVHNRNLGKIVESLGICTLKDVSPRRSEGKEEEKIYKQKFETLKKKYDDLKEKLDTRIHLDLIKAGVFYNKEDIQNILHVVRKYQDESATKKSIIDVQNGIIQNVVERNQICRNKLVVDKRKNEQLLKMCHTYYEQNKKAQMKLRKLKHAFLEYKMALESIVSCCEKIGGDKIILMDVIKSSRAQTDLSIATDILNTKKIQELEMNICYCEHQINCLKDDLDTMLDKLENQKKEKREVMNETLRYKEHLRKNNALLVETLENFRHVITNVDKYISKEDSNNKHDFKEIFDKNKKKYNDLVRKATHKNKEIENVGNKLLLSNSLSKHELKKHQEYLNKQINEIRKNEGSKWGHKEQGLVEEEESIIQYEVEQEEKEKEKKRKQEEEEKTQLANEVEQENEIKGPDRKAEQEVERPDPVDETMEGRIIKQVNGILEKIDVNKLSFQECVDVIYKANLPLTQSKLNKLKGMGEVSKEDLVTFIKTLIINEDEALQNMITFFEIWDVKKTGHMHKELILLILRQFGDSLTDEEMDYLRGEINAMKESNISYIDLLKRWIHGIQE
ncbi:hypothetical protein, conserved [Plasmodium gonderi]|uniref:Myosin light chain B n=1 Tax=Plasmodium gonderi TaxID=77519 RepID=A0A1Y1JHY3_PLAGO|nr:hypothetical protein, conserved [Plasmodium gonderi]GAW80955.1 hypothetical protein, conserved [Plasmodium gonderi]